MAQLNKVFLMGNLTRDPELRYTAGGTAVTDLGLAVNRSWTSEDGDRKDETLFIDVTVWKRQAETCCQYLKKGQPVHVEGYLKLDSWDDKTTGEKRKAVLEALPPVSVASSAPARKMPTRTGVLQPTSTITVS